MKDNSRKWPKHPKIYEINTLPWLNALSEIYGHKITLENIPVELIDQEFINFDAIWLMGIWERSPKSRDIAINNEGLQKEYQKSLRYYNTDDIIGSPYAVYYYHVNSQVGGEEALANFRSELYARGILLILDFIPNHVSIDHLWTLEKSNVFLKGTLDDLMKKPYDYFSLGDNVYAHGKDPNFPSWMDTIQINAFSKEARAKACKTLQIIAQQCDGVRCDMAMLMTNEVFSKNWGEKAGTPLEKEYWVEMIEQIKQEFPNFKFIAEVYWDLEWTLMQQGFDYCYDKKLYDSLANEDSIKINDHLKAKFEYQSKLLRFIENHDEDRAINIFGKEASKAAAIITLTLPGAKLIFEGQTHGYQIKLPLQLKRGPIEEEQIELTEFYDKLLQIIPGKGYDDAKWSLCTIKPIDSTDTTFKNIIAYIWTLRGENLMIIVNYSLTKSKAHIQLDNLNFNSMNLKFIDLLNDKNYIYKIEDLNEFGLYIELDDWKAHIFKFELM
ncbi:MAG: alpha-amylase family glycosyl hydrolase [Candidatus Thorarchaeota archaeon]